MIKRTNIKKDVDEFGKIEIPTEVREHFNIKQRDKLEFVINAGHIMMLPIKGECKFCGCTNEKMLIDYRRQYICEECYENFARMKVAMDYRNNNIREVYNEIEEKANDELIKKLRNNNDEKIINLLRVLTSRTIGIMKKLGINIEDKIYTAKEFQEISDEISEYYKYEEMEEEELAFIKDLSGTGVTEQEVEMVIEEMYELESIYGIE